MKDKTLYSAIIGRHSVRRFQKKSISKEQLGEVVRIIAGVRSLIPENRFEVLIKKIASRTRI
ncbi:MAG TPA: hypothetical protein G4N92_01835 [Anaerolineae bacterium]|nr:hypothetical protein [Anaerolineae bacterium]